MATHVLIIRGEDPFTDLLGRIVAKLGHEVTVIGDALEALRQLDALGVQTDGGVSLVLIDLDLAGTGPLRLLASVRQRYPKESLPVVAVSGGGLQQAAIDRLMDLGANGFIGTGTPLEQLVFRLSGLLAPHHDARDAARVQVDIPVLFAPRPGQKVVGRALNLSMGGLFLASEQLAAPGTMVALRLQLGDDPDTALVLPGIVRWRRDARTGGEGLVYPTGMGVQFQLDLGARTRLGALMGDLLDAAFFTSA